MFRDLIPLLAIAFTSWRPTCRVSGQSDIAGAQQVSPTHRQCGRRIDRFTEVVGLRRFAVYVFDYGAPTGFRIAAKHPDRITGSSRRMAMPTKRA